MAESIVAGLITVGIQVILAISVNIISGYARQLSLGQAAFAGLGAYASALLNVRLGYSFWIACPLSVFLTGGVGLLLGLPCLRGAKHYILVMTLGTNFLLQHLLLDGRFMGGISDSVVFLLHSSLQSRCSRRGICCSFSSPSGYVF